jgi:hypothetical protein
MKEFVEAGRLLPGLAIGEYEDQDRWDREIYPLLRLYRSFGNFSELNFAQVGHGIGYYNGKEPLRPSIRVRTSRRLPKQLMSRRRRFPPQ